MQISFPGKRVLVTGAARGIGRGIVEAFAAEQADVIATDIDAAGLETVRDATPQVLDVTDPRAIARCLEAHGTIDIAIHAAGGIVGRTPAPLETVDDADWRAILAVNLDGAFNIARAVAPGMKTVGTGRIIVISSGAGLRVSRTGIHAYGTAKTAQSGLVRQLASELGQFGITVNAIAPGYMPQTSPDYMPQWQSLGPDGQAAVVESIAMRRLGTPRDIANAALFLASDHADWITGQVVPVMGGP
ncbi:MAG: SDR family NAD(P)-dependent oxidoreductase [Pseudomonadota bacterium]